MKPIILSHTHVRACQKRNHIWREHIWSLYIKPKNQNYFWVQNVVWTQLKERVLNFYVMCTHIFQCRLLNTQTHLEVGKYLVVPGTASKLYGDVELLSWAHFSTVFSWSPLTKKEETHASSVHWNRQLHFIINAIKSKMYLCCHIPVIFVK